MTDDDKALVERLRDVYRVKVPNYIDDAADRIEALSAENERLRNGLDAALNAIEFVRVRDGLMQDENDLCNIARAALGETK